MPNTPLSARWGSNGSHEALEAALSAADAALTTNGVGIPGGGFGRQPWGPSVIEAACWAFLATLDRGEAADRCRQDGWLRKCDLAPVRSYIRYPGSYFRSVTAQDMDRVLGGKS